MQLEMTSLGSIRVPPTGCRLSVKWDFPARVCIADRAAFFPVTPA